MTGLREDVLRLRSHTGHGGPASATGDDSLDSVASCHHGGDWGGSSCSELGFASRKENQAPGPQRV